MCSALSVRGSGRDLGRGALDARLGQPASNAIKYSPAGGEIIIDVSEEDREDGSAFARVCVRDQGVGIPAAEVDRIFDRFYRARNVGSIAGTGIGLSAAHDIVEQHGGTLHVESREGLGSVFVLGLPL